VSAGKRPPSLAVAALLAAAALGLSALHALDQRWGRGLAVAPGPPPSEEALTRNEVRRCSIYHARFGGTSARLAKLVRADVASYVVMEVSRGGHVVPGVQMAWLRGAFDGAEPVWVGHFTSTAGALARAASLCPQARRCETEEPACGPHWRGETAPSSAGGFAFDPSATR
jgi:hypothetical protein